MSLPYALLFCSVLGFLLGPILLQFRRAEAQIRALLDGFALVTAGGLAVFHLIPEAVSLGGGWTLVLAAIGMLSPYLIDRATQRLVGPMTPWVLLLALLPHLFLESGLLAAAKSDSATALAAAMIAHRLPVGVFVYILFRQAYGNKGGWGALMILVVGTLLGFLTVDQWTPTLSDTTLGLFEGFVGGTLLHVAFSYTVQEPKPSVPQTENPCEDEAAHCGHAHDVQKGTLIQWSGAGALVGFSVVILTQWFAHSHPHVHDNLAFGDQFLQFMLLASPALVGAYFTASVLFALIRPQCVDTMNHPPRILQPLRGTLFGLTLPICASGVLPLYTKLQRTGVSPTAALAFLCATPALGLEALFLTAAFMGWEFTVWRIFGALLIALTTALFLRPLLAPPSQDSSHHHHHHHHHHLTDFITRWSNGFKFGFFERFDHTVPWVFTGLFLAAWLSTFHPNGLSTSFDSSITIGIAVLLGLPTYICAAGATPVIAVVLYQGVSPGTALAFLLIGPILHRTLATEFTKIHGFGATDCFIILTVAIAAGSGFVVDALIDPSTPRWALSSEVPTVLQWTATVTLGLLLLRTLFVIGPRAIVARVTHPIQAH